MLKVKIFFKKSQNNIPTLQNYVPRMSPKDVLWTSQYGPLCNAKRHPLQTSLGRWDMTSLGRWNMTSWGRLNVTSWGRPYTALYVTPFDVPYPCLEDVSCRRYEEVPKRSNIQLQGNPSGTALYGSISKTKKRPKHEDFCIWS